MANLCKNKKRFKFEEVAKKTALKLNHRWYKCPHCMGWHTTSQEYKGKKNIKLIDW